MTPRHKTRIPQQEDSFFPTADRVVKTAEEGNDAPSNHPPTQGILSVIPPWVVTTDPADASISPKSFQSISGHSSSAPSMDLTHRFNNLYGAAGGVTGGIGGGAVGGLSHPPSSSKSSKQEGSDADSLALSSLLTMIPSKPNRGLNTTNKLLDEGRSLGKSLGQGSALVGRPMSAIEKAFCFGDDEEENMQFFLPTSVKGDTKSVVAAVVNTTSSTSTITTPDVSPSHLGSMVSINTKKDSFLSIGDQ